MAFSSNSSSGAMADINVTPLVDVMLVLLIIFMITMPLLSNKIQIDLPQPSPISEDALRAQLRVTAQKDPQPELDIKPDRTTKYQLVAQVMADAKNAGMIKIGFVSPAAAGDQ